MKKILSLCAVISLLLSNADARNGYDEVGYMTFKYGLTSISSDFSLDEHTFALDFIGEMSHDFKPKIDFSYISIDKQYGVDYLFQTSINAFIKSDYTYSNIAPYFYGGLGYEYVNNSRPEFDNSFYMQAGAGFEIPISQPSDDLHIVTELRVMQLIGSDSGQDNEVALFLGLRLPIGDTFSIYDTSPSPTVAISDYAEFEDQIPSPQLDKPIRASTTTAVSRHGFADEDGDNVRDSIDICPNTPSDIAVNKVGCPIRDDILRLEEPRKIANYTPKVSSTFKTLPATRKILNIHFKLNSAEIEASSRVIAKQFVESINRTKFSKIIVEGYTDSTGDYEKNLELSKKRAQSVKELMIQYGIDSNSITAIGKGPMNPISTNHTEVGRAENRRIEVVVE